ncbi:hypothetical protein IQ06DRAFT_10310 [Phaeosphaeriaceae sp. SRC1lsM3a]|nr:hypothetical protein IQ06DRAFT_10310 [Stagonospora sp. SRC1lsM3a]
MRVPLSIFGCPRTARAAGPSLCDRLTCCAMGCVGGRGLIIELHVLLAWRLKLRLYLRGRAVSWLVGEYCASQDMPSKTKHAREKGKQHAQRCLSRIDDLDGSMIKGRTSWLCMSG